MFSRLLHFLNLSAITHLLNMPTDPQLSHGLFRSEAHRLPSSRSNRTRAVTLVETMVALVIFSTCMLGFLATFLQSRKTTEAGVLHAAATNIVYGIIEQIKDLDYATMLPCGVVDPGDPNSTPAPNVRVQINQNTIKWLTVKYTAATDTPNTPKAPLTTPAASASAASVFGSAPAAVGMDNIVGPLPLSSAAGATSQNIKLKLWIWIDEMPDTTKEVTDVKRITVVYTYDFITGSSVRTIRNREVFLRTRYQ